MKKLLGLLAAVGLAATSATSVVACTTINDSGDESNKINLGEIDNIFPETILNAYKAKVPSANISQLEVFDYTQTSARIIRTRAASTSTTFDPIEVTFTLKALDISENNVSLVRNILAGAMDENGLIDQSYTMEKLISDKAITSNSIRTSFAAMNGIYLNESDLELTNLTYAENSATVELTSKNQNILKGNQPVILTINHGINSADLLRVTDLGNIYLASKLYEISDLFFEGEYASAMGTYPILFQNLGDRNPLFAYLATDLVISAASITMWADREEKLSEFATTTSSKINLAWGGPSGNSLLRTGTLASDSNTTDITFSLELENRMILGEHRPVSDFKVTRSAYELKNISQIKKEIYDQTDKEFKEGISFEIFEKYSKIHFVGEGEIPTIEILPGSDWIYGFDLRAFDQLKGNIDDEDLVNKLSPPNEGKNPGYKFEFKE